MVLNISEILFIFYYFMVCILAQFRETLIKGLSLTKTQINDITNFIDLA